MLYKQAQITGKLLIHIEAIEMILMATSEVVRIPPRESAPAI